MRFFFTRCKKNGKTIHSPKGIAHYLEHLKFNEKDGTLASDFFEKTGTNTQVELIVKHYHSLMRKNKIEQGDFYGLLE